MRTRCIGPSQLAPIESRMDVKATPIFGALDAAKRPGRSPALFRIGDGGHDRNEPPVSEGTLVLSHTVAVPAIWVRSGSTGHSMHNPRGV
jgi:hypothetical protein